MVYELPIEDKIKMLEDNIYTQARKAYTEELTYEMQKATGQSESQLAIPLRRKETFEKSKARLEALLDEQKALLPKNIEEVE